MTRKWVDCSTDEKLEAIKADIDSRVATAH